MKTSILLNKFGIFLTGACALGFAVTAGAQSVEIQATTVSCKTSALKGTYILNQIGHWYPSNVAPPYVTQETPGACVGVMVADGKGKLTLKSTCRIGDNPKLSITTTGAYNINSDCRGTMTWDFPGTTIKMKDTIVFSPQYNELYVLDLNQGSNLYGVAKLAKP